MATPGTTDVIYMGRPKWSVAHHLPVSGVPSPSKSAAFHHLSRHRYRYATAASIAIGIVLAAIYFTFIKVQQVAKTVHDTAKPWAATVVETQEKAPSADTTAAPASVIQSTTQSSTSSTSVTINGEQVSVPANGTIHKTYIDGNSRSTIDITIRQHSGP